MSLLRNTLGLLVVFTALKSLPPIPSNLPRPIAKNRKSIQTLYKTVGAFVDTASEDIAPASQPTGKILRLPQASLVKNPPQKRLPFAQMTHATDKTAIYLLGGSTGDYSCLDHVHVWHLLGNNQTPWHRPTALPEPRRHHAAVHLQGRIYVAGGQTDRGHCSATVWSYDLQHTGAWFSERPLPLALRRHAMLTAHGQIYALGGETELGKANSALLCYDPVMKSWRELEPWPRPRGGVAVTRHRNWLVVAGGRTVEGRVVASVDAYDLLGGGWKRWPRMREARVWTQVYSVGYEESGRQKHQGAVLCVCGGEDELGRACESVDVLEWQEDGSEKWVAVGEMECARSHHSAIVIGTQVLIVGGHNTSSSSSSSARHRPQLPIEMFCHKRRVWFDGLPPLPENVHNFACALTGDVAQK